MYKAAVKGTATAMVPNLFYPDGRTPNDIKSRGPELCSFARIMSWLKMKLAVILQNNLVSG